jgi:demethylmenaquinone methyltransferase/2-methoxy-6-polyprenyl-1,4-benzoquinol methylase
MIAGPPAVVRDARARAERAGFAMSSDDRVGELLAVLAAAVPRGGRILELGTGVGVGLAWLVHGLSGRTDVEVVSAESDQHIAAIAAEIEWPPFVQLVVADGLSVVQTSGQFDLVFADAPAGKWHGLEHTIEAVRPNGHLVVDDVDPPQWLDEEHRAKTANVRSDLLAHPDLLSVEIAWASGVILSTRRSAASDEADSTSRSAEP